MIIQQQQSLCNSVILSITEGQVPGEPTHQLLPLAVAPTTLHHWWPTSSFRQHVQVSSPTTNAPFPTNGIVINSPIGALTVFDSTHCLKDFLPIFSHNLYVWFANDQSQIYDTLHASTSGRQTVLYPQYASIDYFSSTSTQSSAIFRRPITITTVSELWWPPAR